MALPTVEATQDAERAVLGACLLDTDAVRQAEQVVGHADFADPRLGELFDVIGTLHAAGQPVDPVTVLALAVETGIRGVNGPYLHDLMQATPTASNVTYYARQVYEGATRRRLWAFGRRTQQLAEDGADLSNTMSHVRNEWDAISSTAAGDLTARPLAQVLDGPDDYDWLIPNLLERTDRLILTGGEGSGKTTLMRQIAICAAAGVHPTTFHQAQPVRVLVVDAENTEKQWRRKTRGLVIQARRRGLADPAQTVQLAAVDTMPQGRLDLTSERDRGAIHRLIDTHHPDLLVIGPMYKLIPRAITTDDDAAPLITALDGFRARDIALLIEAHAGHALNGEGDRDMRPRGSSALLGWPEFGFGLRANRDALQGLPRGTKPTVFDLIRWRGDRDEREWPARLVRGGEWPWVDDMNPPARQAHPPVTPVRDYTEPAHEREEEPPWSR